MNGQLFKMWKQMPGILNKKGYEEVFLPYFGEDKVCAYAVYQNENGKIWKTYIIRDSKIQVETKYECTDFGLEAETMTDESKWEKKASEDFHKLKKTHKLNAVHSFATARIVLNMYLRALQRLDKDAKWENFEWIQKKRLILKIDAEADTKTYQDASHTITLGKGLGEDGTSDAEKLRYLCRSFDLLSHEVGHAILFTINNKIKRDTHNQTVFHEAFADLTTMFALISRMDVCERLVTITKGDLRKEKNPLTAFDDHKREVKIGEEVPLSCTLDAQNKRMCKEYTRDMSSNVSDGEHWLELHKASMGISTAFYECLIDMFEKHQKVQSYDSAESLFRVGRLLFDMFLYATQKLEPTKLKIPDIFVHLRNSIIAYLEEYLGSESDTEYRMELIKIVTKNIAAKKKQPIA